MTSASNGEPASRLFMRADTSLVKGQLKEGRIGQFTVMCDEPERIGGTNTAPSPLQYFFLSLGFCLLTQIGRNAEAMGVELDAAEATITGRLSREGDVTKGDAKHGVDSVEVAINIEGPLALDVIAELVKRSEEMCFVSQAIRSPTPMTLSARLNGEDLHLT